MGSWFKTKNENQKLKDEIVRKVSKNEDVQKGPKKINTWEIKSICILKKKLQKN